jgi:Multicopper oxidase
VSGPSRSCTPGRSGPRRSARQRRPSLARPARFRPTDRCQPSSRARSKGRTPQKTVLQLRCRAPRVRRETRVIRRSGYRRNNILDEPVWLDTVLNPRNGGRTVFRPQFAPDFSGSWIHHCHSPQHEDMGMMQQIECVRMLPRPTGIRSVASPRTAPARLLSPPSTRVRRSSRCTARIPPSTIRTRPPASAFPGCEISVPALNDDD